MAWGLVERPVQAMGEGTVHGRSVVVQEAVWGARALGSGCKWPGTWGTQPIVVTEEDARAPARKRRPCMGCWFIDGRLTMGKRSGCTWAVVVGVRGLCRKAWCGASGCMMDAGG